jgi:hypothetical protein
MPHLLGPAGSPLPPSRNEVLLREAVDRLRAQLDECRTQRDELRDLLQQMFDQRGGQIEDNGLDDWDPNYTWWIKDTPLYAGVRVALQEMTAQ